MASVENMEAVSEHAHSTPIHHNGHEMASELHSLPPTSSTQSQSPPTAKFIDPIVPSPTCSHRQTLGNTRVQKVKSSRGTGQTQKPPTHTRRPPKARCHPLAESYAGAFPKDPIQRYLNARRLGWDPKPPPGFSLTTPQVSTKAPDADKRSLSSKLGDLSFNEFLERHRDSIQLHTDGKQQPDTATNLIHTLITANPQTQESIQLVCLSSSIPLRPHLTITTVHR